MAGEVTAKAIIGLSENESGLVLNHLIHSGNLSNFGMLPIESTIKQIDRRTKISGAQWKAENVPQVLAHRCAYLNRLICDR